jgi:multidrug resistance protein MdtO
MDAVAPGVAEWPSPFDWLRDFLKEELAPYPGRGALVARLVVATTVVMILNMTFRIPYGAYGAVYALVISREDPQSTIAAVKIIIVAFVVAAIDVLIGAMLFSGTPLMRMLWIVTSLFTMFFALSALTNYTAAARFGYLVIITIPLWDEHVPQETKVENTLWAVGAIGMASLVTVGIELVFAALRPGDDLVRSVAERLAAVEEVLQFYAAGRPVEAKSADRVTRLSLAGTSRLRRNLRRSAHSMEYGEQLGATVTIVGRLVDLAASLTTLDLRISDDARQRIRTLIENIGNIRADLTEERIPKPAPAPEGNNGQLSIPLLLEMERTVSMIPEIFTGSQSLEAYAPLPSGQAPQVRFFAPDAFSNPEHVKFGLKGCFAASLCYVTYTALAWPGLSTSITTCFLTALTTIGASRQKQVLRFAGAIVGGLIGLAAQVFILPSLDSIAGFTLLFVPVTIVAAWISTSGPRLSYFGVQLATAFYLINLLEFKFQTSLSVARDRVAGVLLGLLMMWLVFDSLWRVPTALEMRRAFISTLRWLAQLAREPLSNNLRIAIEQSYALRDTINRSFNKTRSLADAVWFEFGPSRARDLALRSQIIGWQPTLRTLFVTRVSLLKYRLQVPGFELPEEVRLAQREFDEGLAGALDGLADRLEGKAREQRESLEVSLTRLEQLVNAAAAAGAQGVLAAHLQTFLLLSRRIESLVAALDKEILAPTGDA